MERRQFLKTSILGLFGLLIAPKVIASSFDNNDLKLSNGNEELPKDLINFAEYFSTNYKKLKCGTYTSDCGKYVINYEHRLKDNKTKRFIQTPYKVGHTTGIMDFSKSKCVNMSSSYIFNGIIWCYAMSKIHNHDFVKSDLTAIKCSIENGFSKKELVKNYLELFENNMNELNKKRTNKIYDFLKSN